MKTVNSNPWASAGRLLALTTGLLAVAACNSGTASSPLGISSTTTTNNTTVIASWSNGAVLERRALDANGGMVLDQWPYTQALGQQWRTVPQSDGSVYLMNIASGKALVATGAGDAMQEANLSAGAALNWTVTYAAGAPHQAVFKHVQTGLCLEAAAGNTAPVGVPVHVNTCSGAPAQAWVTTALGTTAPKSTAFQMLDTNSGNLLRETADGNLALAPSDGTRNEQWNIVTNDDGTMTVTNLATGDSLQGLRGTDSLSAPANSPTSAGQTWRLSGPSGTQFDIMSAGDGTCMISVGGATVSQGPCASQGGWTLQSTSVNARVEPKPTTTPNPGVTSTPNPSPTPTNTTTPNVSLVQPWDTGGPIIDDILQGTANDCWLLAALSTVVWSDPSFIENHISVNNDGTYTVTIYDGNGNPWRHTSGVIAANLLYAPNTSLTLANQRIGSQGQAIFWPSLYEQAFLAYAQQNPGVFKTVDDSYLDTGTEVLGYQYITGTNWYYIDYATPASTSNDPFWTNLSYANNNIPVSVLSRSPGNTSDMFNDGVIGDHFYAVLKTSGSGTGRTVTLRNPWGSRAPNVTDASNLGDGEITMNYTTFLNDFYEVQRAESLSGPP